MPSILVVNPNSSAKVTHNLKNILTAPPGVLLEFYTAPAEAPKEIDGLETSRLSEKIALPDILTKELHKKHDGYLICCYSDHPLVDSLSKHTKAPVLGIMQATLLYSYANARLGRSFVLTSTSGWNQLLDDAITRFAGSGKFPHEKFQSTRALDVLVLSLSDEKEFAKITNRLDKFLKEYQNDGIDCVLLGCAGMAGLDTKLGEKYPELEFIDSVKAGVSFLVLLMHFQGK